MNGWMDESARDIYNKRVVVPETQTHTQNSRDSAQECGSRSSVHGLVRGLLAPMPSERERERSRLPTQPPGFLDAGSVARETCPDFGLRLRTLRSRIFPGDGLGG